MSPRGPTQTSSNVNKVGSAFDRRHQRDIPNSSRWTRCGLCGSLRKLIIPTLGFSRPGRAGPGIIAVPNTRSQTPVVTPKLPGRG